MCYTAEVVAIKTVITQIKKAVGEIKIYKVN